MTKLRTLICGAAFAAANLLMPAPQAHAAPPAPWSVPLCGYAPRAFSPTEPVLLTTALRPC
ncbi:hypothetical protein ACFV1L_19185 [Kitasatospora sp. NPDC059646]|uniref:hypothetical protein n=1 Tax=Kitasatospora sp. NPDC059646 TaxID=3346893 RepID=UPI0036A384B0